MKEVEDKEVGKVQEEEQLVNKVAIRLFMYSIKFWPHPPCSLVIFPLVPPAAGVAVLYF